MTDPERIVARDTGFAAALLRAGSAEQPSRGGIESTLVALGVSTAILTTTTSAAAATGVKAAGTSAGGAGIAAAAVSGAGATAASGVVKAVSVTLLVKWIGLGVVSGVGLAGAAAVVSTPSPSASTLAPSVVAAVATQAASPADAAPPPVATPVAEIVASAAPSVAAAVPLHGSAALVPVEASPGAIEVGAPLAAEVAYVDRARALLGGRSTEAGLGLLSSYEREFPEARLLPEVLFMQLETYDRLGRSAEARRAAKRLLDGFPKSPHASRARKVLAP